MNSHKNLIFAFKQKPVEAIEFLKRKGYKITNNWFDMWEDAHARAFTVAKATKLELLRDLRKSVTQAIESGATFQQFKKELVPQLQKKGWWGKLQNVNKETGEITEYTVGPRRLKTIYKTNLQTAYMAGRYKGQMDAAADLPYLQYIAIIDGKTRESHRDMHGRVFKADDPIWNEFYPPNGWGCRCRVRSLTEKQAERLGARVESSKGRIVEKNVVVGKGENSRQAKVSGVKMPGGKVMWTAPGWNYNPGKEAWAPDLDIYHPADAKAFIRDAFNGPHYKRFFEAKGAIGGVIPIAVLPDDYKRALGAQTSTVRLSADNYFKSDVKHPEITLADLQQTQLHLEQANKAVIVPGEHRAETLVVFNKVGGEYYKTVVKTTNDKMEVFFLSMHKVSEGHLKNVVQRAIKILR